MRDGRIIEQATHDALLAAHRSSKELCTSQFQEALDEVANASS
jgi:ABC-type multidrug transport system fused ATPase/permease subunit